MNIRKLIRDLFGSESVGEWENRCLDEALEYDTRRVLARKLAGRTGQFAGQGGVTPVAKPAPPPATRLWPLPRPEPRGQRWATTHGPSALRRSQRG